MIDVLNTAAFVLLYLFVGIWVSAGAMKVALRTDNLEAVSLPFAGFAVMLWPFVLSLGVILGLGWVVLNLKRKARS